MNGFSHFSYLILWIPCVEILELDSNLDLKLDSFLTSLEFGLMSSFTFLMICPEKQKTVKINFQNFHFFIKTFNNQFGCEWITFLDLFFYFLGLWTMVTPNTKIRQNHEKTFDLPKMSQTKVAQRVFCF